MSSAETKFLLLAADGVIFNDSNPLKFDLLKIAQGTDQNQRIGNRIQLTSVAIRIQHAIQDTAFMRSLLMWVRDGDASSTISLGTTEAIDFDQFIIKWDSKKPAPKLAMNADIIWQNRKFMRTRKVIHYDSNLDSSHQGHNLVLQFYTSATTTVTACNYEIRVFYKDI